MHYLRFNFSTRCVELVSIYASRIVCVESAENKPQKLNSS